MDQQRGAVDANPTGAQRRQRRSMMRKKMTYGSLLQATVGRLNREEKKDPPKTGSPAGLGARITTLHELANGKD